jgi:hypothetical protein
MGYTTDFSGEFFVSPPLSPEQVQYLKDFNKTRRMRRDAAKAAEMPDPVREAVGLPIGVDGGYFVGSTENYGQNRDDSITDYNYPPSGQPGLWCQWAPSDDGKAITWDGGEKFYNYVEWLQYLIEHFLEPWGRKLDGEIHWHGEDSADFGIIEVEANRIRISEGRLTYSEPQDI